MGTHYETIFHCSGDVIGLQETRRPDSHSQGRNACAHLWGNWGGTATGAHPWNLAREAFPPPTPGGLLLRKGWTSRLVPPNANDPVLQKLWTSGRWLHVCATRGVGNRLINIQVVYGIPNQRALNEAFWELVLYYTSGLGNSSQIILTDADFNFEKQDCMPVAALALVALSDGWLVDADLHARLRGTTCVGSFPKDGHAHTRIDCALLDPTLASSLQQVKEVSNHGLPGHDAVCDELDLEQPMKRVAKLRKLPPFSIPPREQEDTAAVVKILGNRRTIAVVKILLKPQLNKSHAKLLPEHPLMNFGLCGPSLQRRQG